MSDCRLNFLRNLETSLVSSLDHDQLQMVVTAATKILEGYEITERCTEVAVQDDTNEKLLKRYSACLRVDGKSERTIRQYTWALKKMSDYLRKPFQECGAYDIRFFLAAEKERGVSNRTLENTRSYLAAFYKWMTAEEIVQKDPMKTINPIKYVDEVRKPFSDTEIDTLRSACVSTRDRAILEFLLSSGVRVSELTQMERTDVDLTTMVVHVKHGKGGKERITYITSVCAKHLAKYLESRTDEGARLFIGKQGNLTPGGIQTMLRRTGQAAGVSNVHPHRFRRTFATGLANRGMDIQEIRRLLGHSSINTTLTYICTDDEKVKASYKKYIA